MANRSFYVSNSGNDANPGSIDKPFLTINGAFARVKDLGAGDRIVVMPGTYNESVQVKAGGDATSNLMLVSQEPRKALIRSPAKSYSAINIQKSYVTVDGFDVSGSGTGHGIEATFLDGDTSKNGPHHLTVINNVCHDLAGAGIALAYGDFYLIDNNECFKTCATNTYQSSGISVYEPRAVAGTEDLRIVITNNRSYSNQYMTPGVQHSDGNGIILDDFRGTQQKSSPGPYKFKTLVENNLCYLNGGKGIHAYFSDNITVRNNTCAFNNRDPLNPGTWRAELSNQSGSNNVWERNVAYADVKVNSYNRAVMDVSSVEANVNVKWDKNLTFNGTVGAASLNHSPANPTLAASGTNLLGVDPLFLSATDFHLQAASPANVAGLGAAQLRTAIAPAPAPTPAPIVITADMIPNAGAILADLLNSLVASGAVITLPGKKST